MQNRILLGQNDLLCFLVVVLQKRAVGMGIPAIVSMFRRWILAHHDAISRNSFPNSAQSTKYVLPSSLDIPLTVGNLGLDGDESALFCLYQFQTSGWCRRGYPGNGWQVRERSGENSCIFACDFLDQLIILVWAFPLHGNVRSVVVEVDRIVTVVTVIHVVIMTHHEIVVVIPRDHRMIGKISTWVSRAGFFLVVMIAADVILARAVQFNIINAIIASDQDPHRQGRFLLNLKWMDFGDCLERAVIVHHHGIDHHHSKHRILFIDMKKMMINGSNSLGIRTKFLSFFSCCFM